MGRGDMDILDFKRMLFLGGRISEKTPLFKILAKLGYEDAEKYALCEFFDWLEKQKDDVGVMVIAKKFYELRGMGRLFPTLKELTRISMILGDTTDVRSFKKQKKKSKGENAA